MSGRVRPAPRPAWTRDSRAVRIDDVVGMDDLGPRWAWEGATGEGVRVAVIDSGIEADHPALGGAVDVDGGAAVVLEDGEPRLQPGAHDDVFGHGTACAGIVHAMAPGASIHSIRVLDGSLTGKATTFLAGLAWAIEQGFDVVNLSLGTIRREYALAFHDLCDEAYFKGVLLVTAANNQRRTSFPSLYSSVTSVACNLATDPWRFHFNPRPPTEFLARGIDVEVAWKGGTTSTVTGNSYAAPHIAGIAARILSKHPQLRPFQVKAVLHACAANVLEADASVAGRMSRVLQRTGSATERRSAMVQLPREVRG